MLSLQFFCGFFLGVICIDWRFDTILKNDEGKDDKTLRAVYSYYWTIQSGGHVKRIMNFALAVTTFLVAYRTYFDRSVESTVVLVALLLGAVYFLTFVRPAAEQLRNYKHILNYQKKDLDEKDAKAAKLLLAKIRQGHIILFFLIIFALVCLPQ